MRTRPQVPKLGLAARTALLAALSATAALLLVSRASATSERFMYKFPCAAGQTCYCTNGPHVNNALDFQIGNPSQSDPIHAMAEGSVLAQGSDSDVCSPVGHLGRWVQVHDIFDHWETYGHLASWLVPQNGWVLQGDELAVEGNTGNAENCAIHLHWEPGTGAPTYIDGAYLPGLTPITTVTSTNSVIGDTQTQQGLALREEYRVLGVQGGNRSWWVVDWTSDNRGLGNDQLVMHRDGAGYEQTFRHDAGYECGEHNGIYVSDNRPSHAYWVDFCLWDTWVRPASNYPMASGRSGTGFPRVDPSASYCPFQLAGCVRFQAFYHGYVWMNNLAQSWSVAAPDVDGSGVLNFVGDVICVAKAALVYPYSQQYDAGCDVNANGVDTFTGDAMQTVKIVQPYVRPPYQSRVPGGITCTPH
jgi:hypothetical protein